MNIDPATLIPNAVALLAPALPLLYGFAKETAKGAAGKLGETVIEKADALLTKLKAKFSSRPALEEAVKDVAKQPDDADAQAALRVQLRKLLEAEPDFAGELHQIVSTVNNNNMTQHVSGTGNFAVIGKQTIGSVTQNFGNK